ncbi:hypothetical protein ACJ72_04202 [Emergomyces africanus]|uniref:Extracellular membrane protein CFEM domain-containing protein n=1 Tax=Emergomyces africanus TaxID=1955775 RepID=A0A1B7NXI3_9EURO|nr:hypothetical protein ACJ72_04202 [Emergomyces africanus]
MKIDIPLALALVLATTGTIAAAKGSRVILCKEGFHCNADIDCQADKDCQKKAEGMDQKLKTIAVYCHDVKHRCEVVHTYPVPKLPIGKTDNQPEKQNFPASRKKKRTRGAGIAKKDIKLSF